MANIENFNTHRLKRHLELATEAVRSPQDDDELFEQVTDGGDRRKEERRIAFASYIENDRREQRDRRGPESNRRTPAWMADRTN